MPVTSAVTHKTNVSNYDKFVIDIAALGATYNPTKANIKLDALNALNVKIKAADAAETNALLALNNARMARADVFAKSKDVVTRIANAIRATDIPQNVEQSLITVANKFLGRDSSVKKDVLVTAADGTTSVTQKSTASSHQDMDSKLAYLDTFIKQLGTVTAYNPNEANLKLANLVAIFTDMKAKRTAEITAATAYTNCVIASNELMYVDVLGMVELTNDVKLYVKAVFGTSSSQYKALTTLKFKKMKRK